MVERVRTRRGKRGDAARRGPGRPRGKGPEYKSVARARAARAGMLPDELMHLWAWSGQMEEFDTLGRSRGHVKLAPSDRISCAKGCAEFFKSKKQAVRPPDEAPQPINVVLDEHLLAALSARSPDRLEIVRDVLQAIAAAAGDVGSIQAAAVAARTGSGRAADASAYARTLGPDTETQGSA